MKDIIIELIKRIFDFKVLVILLVVGGALSQEWAVLYLGVATETVLDFVNKIKGG